MQQDIASLLQLTYSDVTSRTPPSYDPNNPENRWLNKLANVEHILNSNLEKGRQLAKEHDLSQEELTSFEQGMIATLYSAAREREQYEWQAGFAMRHGI